MNLPTVRYLLLLAIAAFVAGCKGAAPLTAQSSAEFRHETSSDVHLYVVDSLGGKVYRYLLSKGLPQTTPDEVFATVTNGRFLGVDRAQNIYVAGSNTSAGFVEKFAPDGSLLGTAQLGVTVAAFATDADGYFYVVPGSASGEIYTYGPSAVGSGSIAQPVAVLTGKTQGGGGFGSTPGLAIDGRGPLYQASILWINVFDHPRKTSPESALIKAPSLGFAPYFDGAVATAKGQLYANIGFGDYCEGPRRSCRPYYWYLTDFGAISRDLVRAKFKMIRARNCFFAGSSGARRRVQPLSGSFYYRSSGVVTGMAVFDGYVDAACTGDATAVWVYRADEFDHQKPVEVLSGPTIPTDAKIGP